MEDLQAGPFWFGTGCMLWGLDRNFQKKLNERLCCKNSKYVIPYLRALETQYEKNNLDNNHNKIVDQTSNPNFN